MKLVSLIKMCLNETYSKVHIGKHLSDSFPIQNDLMQRDVIFLHPVARSITQSFSSGCKNITLCIAVKQNASIRTTVPHEDKKKTEQRDALSPLLFML
jgi:hypothetical protein